MLNPTPDTHYLVLDGPLKGRSLACVNTDFEHPLDPFAEKCVRYYLRRLSNGGAVWSIEPLESPE